MGNLLDASTLPESRLHEKVPYENVLLIQKSDCPEGTEALEF